MTTRTKTSTAAKTDRQLRTWMMDEKMRTDGMMKQTQRTNDVIRMGLKDGEDGGRCDED